MIEPGEVGAAGVGTLPAPAAVLENLQPARLRVHPLTRLERESGGAGTGGGRTRLVCHLELLDRFGHGCKWLGRVRVELYRPGEATGEGATAAGTGPMGAVGGGEQQEGVWNIDATDPAKNAETFDWVTRTYKVELVGLPGWVEALEQGRSREPWATLRAYFLVAGPDGREKRLEATFRLRRGARGEP